MDYWAETMQDDVYLLVQDGWKAVQSDGQNRGKPNTDLIPEPLIVARYFAKEQAAIEKLEADRDAITRQMEELDEEHGGEDGLLFEAKTDKGKLTRASVNARLKEIMYDKDAAEERQQLQAYLALIEKEAAASKRVKDAQKALDAQVAAKYSKLTDGRDPDPGGRRQMAGHGSPPTCRASWTASRRRSPAASGNWPNATPRRCPSSFGEVEALAARVDEHLQEDGIPLMSKAKKPPVQGRRLDLRGPRPFHPRHRPGTRRPGQTCRQCQPHAPQLAHRLLHRRVRTARRGPGSIRRKAAGKPVCPAYSETASVGPKSGSCGAIGSFIRPIPRFGSR